MANQGVEREDGFKERRRKYEEKWALDEELRFKVTARRNKLVGRWAAGMLGLSNDAAEEYAKAVVATGLHAGGVEKVIEKLAADLEGAGLGPDDIHAKLDEFTLLATEEVQQAK